MFWDDPNEKTIMIEFTNLGRQVCDYFAQHSEILAAYIFGSQAKGRGSKLSDVDIAVLLREGIDPIQQFKLRLQFMVDLEGIYRRWVDVVILNQAKPLLQHQVLKYGRLLYESERERRIQFEVMARKVYFDIKPGLELQSKALFRQIKEVGLSGRYRGHRNSLEAVRRLHQRLAAISKAKP